MSEAVVRFERVVKNYRTGAFRTRRVVALNDVSLAIPAGTIFGLLGPNRAGKSTLLKILLSVCRPTSGASWRFGRPTTDVSTLARVGFMHENQAFPRYLTAPSLLDYYGALTGVSKFTRRRRGAELLERVGLADRAAEPIANFSKGMIQRLALAQALLNQPDLLVLDEPTEGLDQTARRLIHDLIAQQKKDGRTTLLVSHIVDDVDRLCDRAAIVVRGRVAYEGPLDALRAAPDGAPQSLGEALTRFYEAPPA